MHYQGIPLHHDDKPQAVEGRAYFAVEERVHGRRPVIRLQSLLPRDSHGRPQVEGVLGTFGEGKALTVRRVVGAVVVIHVPMLGLALRAYPLEEMAAQAQARALTLRTHSLSVVDGHAH